MLHSKVRSSMPRLPGEIRASPILCLQVGHDGRSAMEVLITQTSETPNDRRDQEFQFTHAASLRQNSGTIIRMPRNHTKKSELVPQVTGGCVTGTALALKPPIPEGRGRARLGPANLKSADVGVAAEARPGWHVISEKVRSPRGGQFCYPRAFCSVAPLSLRVGVISPSSQSCS